MAQAPLQSPIYYFNTEVAPRVRQQQPQFYQQQYQSQYFAPQQPTNDYFSLPYTPARPRSARTAPHMLYSSQPQYPQAMLTPAASPMVDVNGKPLMLSQQEMQARCMMPLDTDCGDYSYGPATPSLSSSRSSLSGESPACYPMLPTPGSEIYLGSFDGHKQCDEDVFSEVLNGGDWSRSASPPLTPGTCFITIGRGLFDALKS